MKLHKPSKGSLVLLQHDDGTGPVALRRASDGRFYEPHDPLYTNQPLANSFTWAEVKLLLADASYFEVWEIGEAL